MAKRIETMMRERLGLGPKKQSKTIRYEMLRKMHDDIDKREAEEKNKNKEAQEAIKKEVLKMTKIDKEQILYCMIEGCIKEPFYVKTFVKTVVSWFPNNLEYWVSELNKHAEDPVIYIDNKSSRS